MEIGVSGKISHTLYNDYYIAAHGYSYVDVYYEEAYDVAANTSVITITEITFRHSKFGGSWDVYGAITINGKAYSFREKMTSGGSAANVITSEAIAHDDATGKRTITISTAINTVGGSGDTQFFAENHGTAAVTVALTTIPRLSEVVAAVGTLGEVQAVRVDRKSAAYTHRVTWQCGSESGTLCDRSGETALTWTPPLHLALQNATGETVTVRFYTETYAGETVIGGKTTDVSYGIPDHIKPSVAEGWAVAVPYNVGTDAAAIGACVQGYSRAEVIFDSGCIDMSGCYGAELVSYKIVHNGTAVTAAPYRTGLLTGAGTHTVTCYAYDSRGRFAAVDLQVPVYAYSAPTLSDISVHRSNSYGEASEEGRYIAVQVTANISSINGLNVPRLQVRYGIGGGSFGPYLDIAPNDLTAVGGGNILPTQSYVAELLLTDSLGNTAGYSQLIPTAERFFHGRIGGKGAAFGKYAEKDDTLQLAWDLEVEGSVAVDGDLSVGGKPLRDLIYPVGSVFISTLSPSPADLCGGTWEQITDSVLVAAGEASPVLDLGETPALAVYMWKRTE